MLYGAGISRKKRRVFQNVLKYVRKVRAMNWNIESCKDFCEGCESKNTKIAVMCVCVRAWEHHFKICWYTTLLSCSLGVEDKQRSFVFISWSESKKRPTFLEKCGRFSKFSRTFLEKRWSFFPKHWTFLGRISDNFCLFFQGVATCVAALWLKKWSVVISWRLNEVLRRLSKGL